MQKRVWGREKHFGQNPDGGFEHEIAEQVFQNDDEWKAEVDQGDEAAGERQWQKCNNEMFGGQMSC